MPGCLIYRCVPIGVGLLGISLERKQNADTFGMVTLGRDEEWEHAFVLSLDWVPLQPQQCAEAVCFALLCSTKDRSRSTVAADTEVSLALDKQAENLVLACGGFGAVLTCFISLPSTLPCLSLSLYFC